MYRLARPTLNAFVSMLSGGSASCMSKMGEWRASMTQI